MLLGIIFLNIEMNKSHYLRDEMSFYALFAVNKAKHILNRHFLAPVVTQFIVKV